MKIQNAATAACFLLGGLPFALGHENEAIIEKPFERVRQDTAQSNLRSKTDPKKSVESVSVEENEELWERILRDQMSLSLTPQPTPRPITTPVTALTRRPTFSPTIQITSSPTIQITSSPTTLAPVFPASEQCELEMDIKCVVPQGDFRIPCKEFPEPEDEPFCVQPVQYIFKITNICDPRDDPNCDTAVIESFDMVRNGVLKDLMPILPPGAALDPTNSAVYIESGTEFDFCKNQTIDTNAVITGTTAPGFTIDICAAEASNIFNIGFPPDKPCNVAVDLACFIEDAEGTKTNCRDVPMPTDDDECMKDVVYAYIVTNVGEQKKTILDIKRTRDGETVDLNGFLDRTEIQPKQFAVARELDTLDFCVQRLVTTTVSTESEAYGVGDLKCFDEDTHTFSIAISCDVDVKIQCFADSGGGFTVPCEDFNPFTSGNVVCEQVIKYIYTITNTGPGDERIESVRVTRDGQTTNILERQFELKPDEVEEITDFTLFDYCKSNPGDLSTEVEVNADMVPIGGACSDIDAYFFDAPAEECNINIDPFVRCTLVVNGRTISCLDYIGSIGDPTDSAQCKRDVRFEVTLINDGFSCIDITKVEGKLESRDFVDITPAQDVTLCPKETYVVVHTDRQDLCDEDLTETVTIEVNGGPPETCGGFGSLTVPPPPAVIEECSVELSLSCSTLDGGSCQIPRGQQSCKSHPSYVEFKFTGKECGSSSHQHGSNFKCEDLGSMKGLNGVHITIKGQETLFDASVAKGDSFRIGNGYHALPETIQVTVRDRKGGKLLQRLTHQASCSYPTNTHDVFGSLTILGFGDKDGGVEAMDREVEITYEVNNIGSNVALLEEMIISVNNEDLSRNILKLYQLQAGKTYTGRSTIDIVTMGNRDSVTVTGFLLAESLSALRCNVESNIEIGVVDITEMPTPSPTLPPTAPPTLAPTEPPFEFHCKCTDCPHAFKFRFSGGTCEDSKNNQKFWCSDKEEILDEARIIVTDSDHRKIFFEGEVRRDGFFEIKADYGKLCGNTVFKIMVHDSSKSRRDSSEWKVAQVVKFDTSCHSALFLEDKFGSIEVFGWKNKEQGKVVVGGNNKNCA